MHRSGPSPAAPAAHVPRSERNINEVFIMYSHTFPHLSERFFKGATWPPVEAVLHLVDGDHVFGLLYKEMYYRWGGWCTHMSR